MKPTKKCNIDPVQIILCITGDLEESKSVDIKKHLLLCQNCNAYYHSLQKEKSAFPSAYPFDTMKVDKIFLETKAKEDVKKENDKKHSLEILPNQPYNKTQILRDIHEGKSTKTPFSTLKKYYSLAACFVLIIVGTYFLQSSNMVQSKGKSMLTMYQKQKDDSFSLVTDAALHPGTLIQFTYTNEYDSYFSLYSLDGSGTVSKLFPDRADDSEKLQKGSNISLPHSFKLDEYIGKELYVGVFSKKKHSAAVMIDILTKTFKKRNSLDDFHLPDTPRYRVVIIPIEKIPL